ncbi:barwin-like endoglucanase [Lecanosticta acicola]|uniref:Barwin-like endoglucanase n=1 Tax=Lecanosticta acicola TaxID=111012 RepID=A0AAI8YTI0_9PEZI|nr:barwin-like endoglucanase [Lecanosticta acicola]
MLSRSILPALAALFSFAAASFSGEATYYGGNTQGGACSFSTYTLPSGLYGTALSDSNWDNSEACGGCVQVTGPTGKNITAMVTDQCPGCGQNHLDLYENAFPELAAKSAGHIQVTWDWVECPISSPLEIHMKSGVSAYWFSAQVVNGNKRTASMSVSTDGGSTWKDGLTRKTYNFFENSSGFGTTTVDVRVESEDGDRVIVKNVAVTGDSKTTASGNY